MKYAFDYRNIGWSNYLRDKVHIEWWRKGSLCKLIIIMYMYIELIFKESRELLNQISQISGYTFLKSSECTFSFL